MGKGKRVAVAPILPMLPLEALVVLLVAGLSAVAAATSAGDMVLGGGGAVIRLPSDATAPSGGEARADEATTAVSAAPGDYYYGERPWKCCNVQVCTMSALPTCWCHDRVERCYEACKECRKLGGSDPPRYVCRDVYRGEPAPRCTRLA